jgi:hypothetical protein
MKAPDDSSDMRSKSSACLSHLMYPTSVRTHGLKLWAAMSTGGQTPDSGLGTSLAPRLLFSLPALSPGLFATTQPAHPTASNQHTLRSGLWPSL